MKEVLDMVLQELRSFRQDVNARFHTIETTMEKRFEAVDKQFEYMHEQFAYMHEQFAYMHEQFAYMHQRFNLIDDRFSSNDQKFISIDQQFISIDQQFLLVHVRLDQIDESIQVLSDQQRDDILALVKKTSETKPN